MNNIVLKGEIVGFSALSKESLVAILQRHFPKIELSIQSSESSTYVLPSLESVCFTYKVNPSLPNLNKLLIVKFNGEWEHKFIFKSKLQTVVLNYFDVWIDLKKLLNL